MLKRLIFIGLIVLAMVCVLPLLADDEACLDWDDFIPRAGQENKVIFEDDFNKFCGDQARVLGAVYAQLMQDNTGSDNPEQGCASPRLVPTGKGIMMLGSDTFAPDMYLGCHNLGIDLTNAGDDGTDDDRRGDNRNVNNDCDEEPIDDEEEACDIIGGGDNGDDDDTDWPGTAWDGTQVGDNLGQCDLNPNSNPIVYDSNGDCIFTGVFP